MVTSESEHIAVTRGCKSALTAKESPITQKRLLELIEYEKKRLAGTEQASGEPQGKTK